jgi:hypothetical protein
MAASCFAGNLSYTKNNQRFGADGQSQASSNYG